MSLYFCPRRRREFLALLQIAWQKGQYRCIKLKIVWTDVCQASVKAIVLTRTKLTKEQCCKICKQWVTHYCSRKLLWDVMILVWLRADVASLQKSLFLLLWVDGTSWNVSCYYLQLISWYPLLSTRFYSFVFGFNKPTMYRPSDILKEVFNSRSMPLWMYLCLSTWILDMGESMSSS